jgi:hypothetical protein
MSAHRAARLRVVFLFFVFAFAVTNAYAQDDAYKRGLGARDDERWSEVVTQMQMAIAVDGRESARRVDRGVFRRDTPYLPYYFLGEALFRQDNCAGAMEAWSASQQQGFVLKEENYRRTLERGLDDCSKRGYVPSKEYQVHLAAIQQALSTASATAGRVMNLQKEHRDLWQLHTDWAERYERGRNEFNSASKSEASGKASRRRGELEAARAASSRAVEILSSLEKEIGAAVEFARVIETQAREIEQSIAAAESNERTLDSLGAQLPPAVTGDRQKARALIEEAKSQLATGRRAQNEAAIGSARDASRQALILLEGALGAANAIKATDVKALDGDVAKGTDLFSGLEASLARLDTLLSQTSARAPSDAAAQGETVRGRITGARRRFEQSRAKGDRAGVLRAVGAGLAAGQELEALIARLNELVRPEGVTAALADGARLFLDGEYQRALAVLDAALGDVEGVPAFHAQLMRAASLYKLYIRSGAKDQSLLTRAVAAVEECRRQDSTFAPDSRVFDPRFIRFFQTGAAVEAPSSGAGTTR